MADQEEIVAELIKRARAVHTEDEFVTAEELERLVQSAAYGTPGGFTDEEGEAFLGWAVRIRAKCAILETILDGVIYPDIKGMVDAKSNFMLYMLTTATARRAEHEQQPSNP
jgi:hypothetical protein